MNASRREEVRSALTALQIDRVRERASSATPPIRFPRRVAVTLALVCSAGFAAGLIWKILHVDPIRVEVGYASRVSGSGSPAPVLSGTGYLVTGDRYISLGARVPGRVTRYLVNEGERVEAGQPLVRLDDRHYAAALHEVEASQRIADANLNLRRKELARMQLLQDQGAASRAALDVKDNEVRVAAAEFEGLTARIASLRLDLEETIVRAPTAGVVLEKLKEVGEMAVPGGFAGSGELIRIANMDELRAEVDVNESDLAKVELGQRSDVVPDAFPSRRYSAEVVKLYPQINRQKGTLRVETRILEPDEALRPDMAVRVRFLERESKAVAEPFVTAPRNAIRKDAGGYYVWSVAGGRVTRRSVQPGSEVNADLLEVLAGLEGGEMLVLGEVANLGEASAVEISNGG
jgi:RND family efflux transporter, MFP subunit